MHPAYSVILFTTASGAGYGLLVWLGFGRLLRLLPLTATFTCAAFGLALALITAGLFSSLAHLGRPERAWRALSQWRSSWLSREGVMALATYVPGGLLALSSLWFRGVGPLTEALALLTVAAALLTLITTGMIYASLRTIRQWHQPLTVPVLIGFGLASGAVLNNLVLALLTGTPRWAAWAAIVSLAAAGILKWAYWRTIDGELRSHTVEAATGLGRFGKVRPLEPPHTEPNYIMREMGYRVARKHVTTLRQLVGVLAVAVPLALSLLSLLPALALMAAALAAASMTVGVVIERWLFFAEAEHVVMLYYGADVA